LVLNAASNDDFTSTINGGALTLAAGNVFSLQTLFINTSTGSLTIQGTANVENFTTNGLLMVDGTLTNVGASGLNFGGNSSLTTVTSTGLIDIGDYDALLINGVFVLTNNGLVGSANPSADLVVDFGGLVKGSGTYTSILTQNGGAFSPGASPGQGDTSNFNVNSGGTYRFEIANAIGTQGQHDGWDITYVRPNTFVADSTLNFTALTATKYNIEIVSLFNGLNYNTPGLVSNFNPNNTYMWKFIDATDPTAQIVGIIDPNAFNIVTSEFMNSFSGSFSVVTTDGGHSLSILYSPVPTLAALTPTTGPVNSTIVINGSGLANTTTVTFGGVSASFVVDSDMQITATAPVGSGTVDVVVTTTGGSTTLSNAFSYVAAIPPTAPTVTVNDGQNIVDANQQSGFATFSRILTVELNFNTVVISVDAGAFMFFNGTDTVSNDGAVTVTGQGTTSLILTFTGTNSTLGEEYYSLADGIWALTTNLTKVHTNGGVGVGSGVTQNIRRLFGDVNGTGTVDGGDFGLFGSTFGLNDQDPSFNAQFDVNADGCINGGDFGPFGSRFGTGL